MTSTARGIALIVAQAAFFFADTAVLHVIGGSASIMQVALLRSFGGLVLVAALSWRAGWSVLRTSILPLQLLRGASSVLYLWIMVYSFAGMPLTDATAISYLQAPYLVLFAALILGERPRGVQWIAAGLSVTGAMFIIRPAFGEIGPIYWIAAAGTGLNAFAFILTKLLERRDSALTVMLYVNLIGVLCNLPCLAGTALPAPHVWPWLAAGALLGPAGMYFGILAVRATDVSVLAPYTYVRLLLVLALGGPLFGNTVDAVGMIGGLCIFAGCLLVLPRRARVLKAA